MGWRTEPSLRRRDYYSAVAICKSLAELIVTTYRGLAMNLDLGLHNTPDEARAAGEAWARRIDPSLQVGALHHIVPRFYLQRFSGNGKVRRRAPAETATQLVNVTSLGIRDFYTAVSDRRPPAEHAAAPDDADQDRYLDSALEQVLTRIEGWGADVLRRLTDEPGAPVRMDERYALTQFLSFQFVRGCRRRREIEKIGEYWAKTMLSDGAVPRKVRREADLRAARRAGRSTGRGNGGWKKRRPSAAPRLTEAQLRDLSITPHPNEHLRMLGDSAHQVGEHLFPRPVTVVEFDQPYLLTCDEPVLVLDPADRQHLPSCALTDRERARRRNKALIAGREFSDVVHVYPTRPSGVALAEEIAFPIDPTRLLLLGPKETVDQPHLRVVGREAKRIADDINARVAAQAYLWVVGHQDNDAIHEVDLPAVGPLFGVCDGASAARDALAASPSPVRTTRLRRSDLQQE